MEEVRWTPAGKAALAEIHGEVLRDAKDADLRARVFKEAKRFAPQWKRGLAKADDEGKAAAALAAATLAKGKLPKRLTVDDAAYLASLMGASSSEHAAPFTELVIRAEGLPFAMAVCARMWSLVTTSDNPDWPKSEKRAALYVCAIDDDHEHVHDASCSYAKAAYTRYLERRYRTGTTKERTEMKKGVTAVWKTTTPHARPPLAFATRDPKRAKESALELIDAGESPWPFFAWDHLPYVIDDAALVLKLLGSERALSLDLISNLGTAIWDAYAERITGSMSSHSRAELLRQMTNFYGPKTALILAEYEDTRECADVVREYFTLYPELLEMIIDEPELKYHRDDLLKLVAAPTKDDKPAQARRRW